jgi:hypothetical protein
MVKYYKGLFRTLLCVLYMSQASTVLGENMKEFDWQATESAPKGYLMEILSGSLVYHDGSGSLFIMAGVEDAPLIL